MARRRWNEPSSLLASNPAVHKAWKSAHPSVLYLGSRSTPIAEDTKISALLSVHEVQRYDYKHGKKVVACTGTASHHVFMGTRKLPLTKISHYDMRTELYKVGFYPDIAVEGGCMHQPHFLEMGPTCCACQTSLST